MLNHLIIDFPILPTKCIVYFQYAKQTSAYHLLGSRDCLLYYLALPFYLFSHLLNHKMI